MTRLRRLLFSALALVALFAGFAGYRLDLWRESPREAWEVISTAAAAGDYGVVYDRYDPASQQRMAPDLRAFAAEVAPDRHAGMTDRERYVLLLETRADVRGQVLPAEVLEVRQVGDRASVHLNRPDPTDHSPVPAQTSIISLTRHGGRWCLSHRADLTH